MAILTLSAKHLSKLYDFLFAMGSQEPIKVTLDSGDEITVSPEAPEFTPLLIGPSGIGKTAILKEWAKNKGVSVFNFIPSQISANDLTFPIVKDGRVFMYINEKLQTADVLFLDEFNRISTPDQIAAVLSIISSREFANQKLAAKLILAAANPATDNFEGVYEFDDSAVLKRVAPIAVEPDWEYVKIHAPMFSPTIDAARAADRGVKESINYVEELIQKKVGEEVSPREIVEANKVVHFAMVEGYIINHPDKKIYERIVHVLTFGLLGSYAVKIETIPPEVFQSNDLPAIIEKFGVYLALTHFKVYAFAKMISLERVESQMKIFANWVRNGLDDPMIVGVAKNWVNHLLMKMRTEKDSERQHIARRMVSHITTLLVSLGIV